MSKRPAAYASALRRVAGWGMITLMRVRPCALGLKAAKGAALANAGGAMPGRGA